MTTISELDLMQVTGGKTPDVTANTTGSSGNDAILSALNGIQSSLKDLGKNNNNSLFSGTNGLMFMTALALSSRNSSNVVVAGGAGPCGGGGCWGPPVGRVRFSFRARW